MNENLVKILENKKSVDSILNEGIFDIFKPKETRAGIEASSKAERANADRLAKSQELYKKTGKYTPPEEGVDTKTAGDVATIDTIITDVKAKFGKVYSDFEARIGKSFGADPSKYPEKAKKLVGIIANAYKEIEDYKPGMESPNPAETTKTETPTGDAKAINKDVADSLRALKFKNDQVSRMMNHQEVKDAKTVEDKIKVALQFKESLLREVALFNE
jgi:hypothetical protein